MKKIVSLILVFAVMITMTHSVYARELKEFEPDGYHWNDKPVDATYLYSGDTLDGRIHSTNDHDWFKFIAPYDGELNILLTNIPTGCNYNVKLYDSYVNKLGGPSKDITAKVKKGFTYYIWVYSNSGYDKNKYYRLSINMN